MAHFTPLPALLGGVLIGGASTLLWIGIGRIAGISGILGGLASARGSDALWRVAFLIGLMAAPMFYRSINGLDVSPSPVSTIFLIVGGLLVGFGSRLGSGCTSGHGVCGIARLSIRSLLATALFTGAAIATVFIIRHLI